MVRDAQAARQDKTVGQSGKERKAAEALGPGCRFNTFDECHPCWPLLGKELMWVETTAASFGMRWPGGPAGEDQAGWCLEAPW